MNSPSSSKPQVLQSGQTVLSQLLIPSLPKCIMLFGIFCLAIRAGAMNVTRYISQIYQIPRFDLWLWGPNVQFCWHLILVVQAVIRTSQQTLP